MPTVLITGGTGMIGRRLSQMLMEKGIEVIVLTRDNSKTKSQNSKNLLSDKENTSAISYAHWDVEKKLIDKNAIEKADFIIHLAGAGVAEKKWTKKRKKEIIESRTKSSALIVDALKENSNKVKAVVSASAIGWYGADTIESLQNGFTEDAPAANDFLGTTCKLWEQSIESVTVLNKRLIKLRTGIVLSNDGGAFTEFKKPLKAGVAAILGSGKQIISWIHIDDICHMYLHAIENENLNGVYNAVAPNPVTNKNFILQLAKLVKNKSFIAVHIPKFILKLMLGELSIEVLKSTTINASKIRAAGFTFLYPSIESALQQLCAKESLQHQQ
ncbi:MAG: TIGR01777 family oxidoreductase [Chitinophagaceae bacterium]